MVVCARSKTLNTSLAVFVNLSKKRIVAQNGHTSHCADRPEEKANNPLTQAKPHMLRQVNFVEAGSAKPVILIGLNGKTYISLVKSLFCFKCFLKLVTRLCAYLLQQMFAH